ncbi:hypothetical protein IFM89_009989 [Coptis chinensis]|uniref:Elongation factor 2 n=1 Tax=Coptis chinensis TaxID=261450 RepID=A0A835LE33_9MAGN|nr:hypothetical protein IFM89_009989 [Coptis chinensis]
MGRILGNNSFSGIIPPAISRFPTMRRLITVRRVIYLKNMRGIFFEVCDVVLHADAIHRVVRSFQRQGESSMLHRLLPSQGDAEAKYSISPLYNIKAYLLVIESFGFSGPLRATTSGHAFPQCVFDHWDMMSSDPLEAGSQASSNPYV